MSFSISPNTVIEGTGGTNTVTFVITRTDTSAAESGTVYYYGAEYGGGTADAADFVGLNGPGFGTVGYSFAVGVATFSFNVSFNTDSIPEPDETFSFQLSPNAGGGPNGSTVFFQRTIIDDDTPSGTLAIDNVTMNEGNAGTTAFTFTVTRSGSTTGAATVDYATAFGTAGSGDFTPVNGTVTFAAGDVTKTITVNIAGDYAIEQTETFTVTLSNPQGATITNATGTGTIVNDDTVGTLTLSNPQVVEGDGLSTSLVYSIGRSGGSGDIDFTLATDNTGTATAGTDFTATSQAYSYRSGVLYANNGGTLTPASGFTVQVFGDQTVEGNETVNVSLASGTAGLTYSGGTGTILNDDAFYAVSSPNVGEGNSGTTPLTFTVTRSGQTGFATTLYAQPVSGTATAGVDFANTVVPVSFASGQTTATFTILINGDTVVEPTETFTVNLYNNSALTVLRATATGTIVNDDTAANVVQGTNGNDLLYATGNGPSTLIGFDGDDTYVVRNINDVIRENQGGGTDIVYSSISYTLNADAQVENLVTQTNADTTSLNLIGNGFNQYVVGNFGNNVLNGNGGVDTLVGLKGDDIYSVGDARAVVLENAGEGNDTVYTTVSYQLGAGASVETLSAQVQSGTGSMTLIGNEQAQTVVGNNGANLLDGGAGADTLIGLGGTDTFSFSTALGNGNVDAIQDFAAGSDRIQLFNGVFTGLGTGTLSSAAFVNGTAATAASAQVIYNQATGQLFFDADGTGSGAAVLFATVTPGTSLQASDITVTATVPTP